MSGFNFNNYNNFENLSINNSLWTKYDNLINSLSNEQKVFVSKQKNVIQAKENLLSAFIDYLFEQNKNSFVLVNDTAKNLADNYILAIQKASESYVTKSEELEKENTELKKKIQQLMLDFGAKDGKDKSATK